MTGFVVTANGVRGGGGREGSIIMMNGRLGGGRVEAGLTSLTEIFLMVS